MKIQQKDIVETNFLLPNREFKPHFAIVVSNNELIEEEGIIYMVLIKIKRKNLIANLMRILSGYKFF